MERAARTFLGEIQERVHAYLDAMLPPVEGPGARLAEAMRYSIMAGGKRVRPGLAWASAEAVGGRGEDSLPFGAAVEMLHTYSLIHDDLPAMDDDDLRRGRPTSHKVFGEALAILAGDALLTHAFELMLEHLHPAEIARRAAYELAHAGGPHGMVGGQVEDVMSDTLPADEATLRRIQAGKTAALLRASCRGGALTGNATDEQVDAVGRFGEHLGHAFQMIDDVLDVTGTAETLGKTPGKDEVEARLTWVALEGVDGARARAEAEIRLANAAIEDLPAPQRLRELGELVIRRDR